MMATWSPFTRRPDIRALRAVACLLLCTQWAGTAAADEPAAHVHYIANMGALIENGETKVVFDPLFSNDHGTYDRAPAAFKNKLMDGIEPFDSVDAVFISHHHWDHFDPATILELLLAQPSIELFGPEQAAAAIRELLSDPNDPVRERIHGLSLANGETATDIEFGALLIEAFRVPHSGWPEYHEDVENIVFRVTLDNETTVMHFGDAGAVDDYYATDPRHWQERKTHFAMPPYWFFLSDEGREILQNRIQPVNAVGMHVPTNVPDEPTDRQQGLQDVDLFTQPGETRIITVTD
jgi:L-ascorbate metabolism protein UlaG (beta-lactamase superfamily)